MTSTYENILGSYTDVVLLKEGGQKAAYRANDPIHGRVVVKIGRYPSASALERIRREVEVLRCLKSSYYPKNIDFRTEAPNLFVIVEEYVESQPLSALLTSFSSPPAALRLLKQLVVALDIIWQKRVVHRDLKPDNILVLADKSPKIIDLGIARLLDEDSVTKTVNVRGPCTPAYAAPEQLKNRKAQIDQRTDQFGLGIVFVQLLLNGRHPFDPNVVGSGDSIPTNILSGNWARATFKALKHAASVEVLITKLLGPEPHNRYRNCDALIRAIETCEGDVS
jgi:serine/threonine-protein kinase